jgi:hypothetical protein
MIRKNDKGELLLNITTVAEKVIPKFTRYNGGWIKQITGIDESKTNGYSLLGEFTPGRLVWNKPGLYLDCSIGGSRKNQEYKYSLFILQPDGTGKYLGVTEVRYERGGDWAPRLWDAITTALREFEEQYQSGDVSPSSTTQTRLELEELALVAKERGLDSALEFITKQIELLKNQKKDD